MRVQAGRQRKEILQLQRAGISTASAELLLERMLAKIEGLCAEREGLKADQAARRRGWSLAAGVGDARAVEMVRREGGRQLTVDRGACRTALAGYARGPLLPARPGDHRRDRPVCREGAGKPRLLSQ